MPRWHYHSFTYGGNLHAAAKWLNENHNDWDVVAMDVVGHYTIIVYRLPMHPELA